MSYPLPSSIQLSYPLPPPSIQPTKCPIHCHLPSSCPIHYHHPPFNPQNVLSIATIPPVVLSISTFPQVVLSIATFPPNKILSPCPSLLTLQLSIPSATFPAVKLHLCYRHLSRPMPCETIHLSHGSARDGAAQCTLVVFTTHGNGR